MWAMLRAAMIWMVVLAIPTQGIAAATLLHCGPGHDLQGPSSASAVEHVDHAKHAGRSGMEKHHHPSAHTAGHSADASAAQPHHDDKPDAVYAERAKYKCSMCAQCCIGAALLYTAPVFALMQGTEPAPTAVPAAAQGFITEAPERPPRHLLA
jgi:hypothetical protein